MLHSAQGAAPEIISQPASTNVLEGSAISLSVDAIGAAPLSYQWYWNSRELSGGTNSRLELLDIRTNNAGLYSVLVSNSWGAIASSNATLKVFPKLVVSFLGQALSSSTGSVYDFEIVANLAFVAEGRNGLVIYDVTDPGAIQKVGAFDTADQAYGVRVIDGYAYVADREAGLQIIDVRNPEIPVRVGGYDTDGQAYGVDVAWPFAYVADKGLKIFDISNPSNISLLALSRRHPSLILLWNECVCLATTWLCSRAEGCTS
jgi:hypothetical protein